MKTEAIIILFIGLLSIAECVWIIFLHGQIEQRDNYIARAKREFAEMTRQLNITKAALRRSGVE